jgi:hypothetical protein
METYQGWVADKLACQPEERLLEVVVGLRRDIVVLKVLLSVECDGLGFDFSLLHINLVTGEDDWDVLADANQVTFRENLVDVMQQVGSRIGRTVPVRNVLVGNSGCNIKHDDAALPVNVISVTKTTELLLSCSIPYIELNLPQVLPAR